MCEGSLRRDGVYVYVVFSEKQRHNPCVVPDMPMLVHGHVSVQKTQASTCAQRTVMCEEKLIVTPRSEID